MKLNKTRLTVLVGFLLIVSALLLRAADKYTAKVPDGLAFSEFKGCESWQAIAISRNERVMAMTSGNPAMIDAYKAGFPANGKPSRTAPRWPRSTGCRK